MKLPPNLTRAALADYRRELKRARDEFGGRQGLATRDRLVSRFRQIADGAAPGHRHAFVEAGQRNVLCVTVGPLLVFFDADTRDVLRIIDGRRDLSRVFDGT